MSAAFTFGAIVSITLFRPTWRLGLVVTIALLLGYALDAADGQVARLRGGGTPAGEWLDHVLDAAKISTFHLAVAICWVRFYHLSSRSMLLIPLGFAVVAAVFFFAITLADMLRRIANARAGGMGVATASVDPDESAPILRSVIVLPNDYGVLCLSVLLVGTQSAFTAVYTALFAANAMFLVVGCLRWFREMHGLAPAGHSNRES